MILLHIIKQKSVQYNLSVHEHHILREET